MGSIYKSLDTEKLFLGFLVVTYQIIIQLEQYPYSTIDWCCLVREVNYRNLAEDVGQKKGVHS